MKAKLLSALCLYCMAGFVQAGYEKSTAWATVNQITAQATDHRFAISGATLCGTNVFTIHTTNDAGREQFAIVLAAASSGKKIFLETWVGCPSTDPAQNWGMPANPIAITVQY
jgi:hypothetical protein